ncbi:MAG: hypothetical protein GW878_01685, partial [Acidobacteria bacterium]|nr:hypothetical protein [Acidobacteriota bacterium]
MDQSQRPWVTTSPDSSDSRSAWRPDQRVFADRQLDPGDLDSALIIAVQDSGFGVDDGLAGWREALFLEARRRLFPARFPANDARVAPVAQLFVPLALAVVEEQWRRGGDALGRMLPFRRLADAEIQAWPSAAEYRSLLGHLEGEGFVACLAMAQQWRGLTIFDHILGVTGLALWLGRQLARSIPVDLPLLHGGSIGHDVGKFGCVGDEERRIPRLHYYYTHLYYRQR